MLSPVSDPELRAKAAEAALALAEKRGWGALFPTDLARHAGIDPSALYGLNGPDALIIWVEEAFDRAAARGLGPIDPDALMRDRLFDVAMRRFEAMEERRPAAVELDAWLETQPLLRAAIWAQTRPRTARWIAALAGVEDTGVRGALVLPSLAITLGEARQAWRKDEAGDFARTMAALDRGLRQMEGRLDAALGASVRKSADPAT